MVNWYRINNQEVLLYGEELPEWENRQENVKIQDYPDLPIVKYSELFVPRSRDKVLEEEHIETFNQLSYAYNLLMQKRLNTSKRVRDFVKEKYIELLNIL